MFSRTIIKEMKRSKIELISKRADRSLLIGKMSHFNKQNNLGKTSEKCGISGNESRKTNLLLGKDQGIYLTSILSKRNDEGCRINGQRRLCTREFSKSNYLKLKKIITAKNCWLKTKTRDFGKVN